ISLLRSSISAFTKLLDIVPASFRSCENCLNVALWGLNFTKPAPKVPSQTWPEPSITMALTSLIGREFFTPGWLVYLVNTLFLVSKRAKPPQVPIQSTLSGVATTQLMLLWGSELIL